jgi:signal recognition particle receptor subunit beta
VKNHKIIFTGPVGAGKTAAISSISDEPIVITDEIASDMAARKKDNTTVAMDYGVMNLGDGQRVHLYGTPGQERFDFMWEILVQGGVGLILLINNSRSDPFKDLDFFVRSFEDFIGRTGVSIGVTHMDEKPTPRIKDYQQFMEKKGWMAPIFEVDARQPRDVSLLLQSLLCSLDPGIDD